MLFSLIKEIDFFSQPLFFLSMLLLLVIPLIISTSFHEAAHAFAAYYLGDNTPKIENRLTLNPMAHFDTAGFLMLLLIGIGWAKPVRCQPKNMTEFMLVAICGPLSNILLGTFFAVLKATLLLKFHYYTGTYAAPLYFLIDTFVYINILLAVFNLIPLPPMDGSRVISWLLPENLREKYNAISPYCIVILVFAFVIFDLNFLFYATDFVIKILYGFLGHIL